MVSDDTNVWVNNASKKRCFNDKGVLEGTSARKGMKRVQPLLGMLQHLILRKADEADGAGQIAQIHAPCQLLPRANSWTILSRMRRWSLYSAAGCAEHFGGGQLWNLFASVPLKLVLHCKGLRLQRLWDDVMFTWARLLSTVCSEILGRCQVVTLSLQTTSAKLQNMFAGMSDVWLETSTAAPLCRLSATACTTRLPWH